MLQLLLAIIYISFISLGLPNSLLGSAWPSMYMGLGVPISYAGIISMLISGGTIISSLLSAYLVRRLGTGKITAISIGAIAIALFGFSISHEFWSLCLWAIPYGLGAGFIDAALNNYVALHFKAKHMNWLHCSWGIGASFGPYIMGACLTNNLGWRFGYRTISIIQIALTTILIFSLPLWKQKHSDIDTSKNQKEHIKIKQLLTTPGVTGILISFFCYCSLEQVIGLWGSSYMVIRKGISSELAASLISLFFLGITGGRFLSGFLTIKLGNKNMVRFGQFIAIIGIVILLFSTDFITTSIGFILIGLGCAPIFPCLLHETPKRFGNNSSQYMMGLQMACAYVGSTFSPPLVGLLIEKINMSLFPLLLLIFMGLMIVTTEIYNFSFTRKE